MGVDNEGNTIVRFTNPPATWGIANGLHFNVNVSLDLGTFVTKTGIRIADADNGTHYDFNGAVVTDHDYTKIVLPGVCPVPVTTVSPSWIGFTFGAGISETLC